MDRIDIPPMPLSGGCQCGKTRYRLHGRPILFYLCHCTECQRHTSSAFGESLRLAKDDLEMQGPLRMISRQAESGAIREGWFCGNCGVRIWHGTQGSPEINIKAGTLDDTSWLVPAGHIWIRSRQPFVNFRAGELTYDRQPPDGYAALKARWAAMIGSDP